MQNGDKTLVVTGNVKDDARWSAADISNAKMTVLYNKTGKPDAGVKVEGQPGTMRFETQHVKPKHGTPYRQLQFSAGQDFMVKFGVPLVPDMEFKFRQGYIGFTGTNLF